MEDSKKIMNFPLDEFQGELRVLCFANKDRRTYVIDDFITMIVVTERDNENNPRQYASKKEMFNKLASDLGIGAKA
jgi:hypothetical protein